MVLLLLSYSIGFMFLLYVTRNVTLVHRIKINDIHCFLWYSVYSSKKNSVFLK